MPNLRENSTNFGILFWYFRKASVMSVHIHFDANIQVYLRMTIITH
jgi:hypothetical protein